MIGKAVGELPELSGVTFYGPDAGNVADTATLRRFKATPPPYVALQNEQGTAIVKVIGGDTIKTAGLTLTVEPSSLRTRSTGLKRAFANCTSVHLCRSDHCQVEPEAIHFPLYGIVQPCVEPAMVAQKQVESVAQMGGWGWRTIWRAWTKGTQVPDAVSESEMEEEKCEASQVSWAGAEGVERLCNGQCYRGLVNRINLLATSGSGEHVSRAQ